MNVIAECDPGFFCIKFGEQPVAGLMCTGDCTKGND